MAEIIEREVDYFKWCSSCKHLMKKGTEDPCNDCLSQFKNTNTDKPVYYEEPDKE